MTSQQSLYERLGGKPAVEETVGVFYEKIIADKRINKIWKGVRLEGLMNMMKKFLRKATGGEDGECGEYDGRNMYEVHKKVNNGNHPTPEQFGIVLEHFVGSLHKLDADEETINEVAAIIKSLRPQILGLENPDE